MAEVFRITTPEGHVYDYHRGVDQLKADHPGAVITGRRVVNDVGEGTYEPWSIAKEQAAQRKADAEKTAKKTSGKKKDEAPAEEPVAVVVEVAPADAPADVPAENGK